MRLDLSRASRRKAKKHIGRWRIFLNNKEVTTRTRAFDSREGWVQLLVVSPQGHAQRSPHNPLTMWTRREYGRVWLRRIWNYDAILGRRNRAGRLP